MREALGWYLLCTPVVSIREEIEKQKSKDHLRKLQSEGKTEKGKADLARLAIIKKQREDAAKKREALRKGEKTTTPPQEESCSFFSYFGKAPDQSRTDQGQSCAFLSFSLKLKNVTFCWSKSVENNREH